MRKLGLLAIVAGLVGAGLLAVSLIPAASQQATTIKVYESNESGFEKFVNTDGRRSIAGDYGVLTRPIYRSKTKTKVGRDVAHITLIRAIGKRNALIRAAATFQFARGKIEVAGYSTTSRLAEGALFTVTGGTGAYAGATGTVTVRETKFRTQFTFRLNP
jgi:hypothetical protein